MKLPALKLLRRDWIVVISVGIMLIVSLIAWTRLSQPLPVHWGVNGEPDRYSNKFEALLLMPLITLALYALISWLPRLDKNHAQNAKVLTLIRGLVVVSMAAIHIGIVLGYLGLNISVPRLVMLVIGAEFIVLGNYLPKVQPSAFVGVRTTWTLNSKKSWYKTQRAGAWVFILTGLAMLSAGIVSGSSWLMLGIIAAMLLAVIGLVFYSYLVWRSDDKRESVI